MRYLDVRTHIIMIYIRTARPLSPQMGTRVNKCSEIEFQNYICIKTSQIQLSILYNDYVHVLNEECQCIYIIHTFSTSVASRVSRETSSESDILSS